jgi:hypothetical protein
MAIYLGTAHKKGISFYQLAKDIGVAQKTAWFMLHRIREMLKAVHTTKIQHTAESNETYMSRKYRSDYKGLSEEEIDYKFRQKYSTDHKGAVLGIADRKEGIIRVMAYPANKKEFITEGVRANIETGGKPAY